jgi:hypothetical protein
VTYRRALDWMIGFIDVLHIPLVGKFLSSCTTGGFSRRAQFREVR